MEEVSLSVCATASTLEARKAEGAAGTTPADRPVWRLRAAGLATAPGTVARGKP